jgi:ATP-binding cassette subfamily B protein/ATP-binding cassette subfamily C protein
MEQTMKKKQAGLLKTTARQFKEFHRLKLDRTYFLVILGVIINSAVNILGIYLTKIIIDAMIYQADNIYFVIGGMMAALIILMLLKRYCDATTNALFIDARIRQFLEFNKRYMMFDYPYIEDVDFNNRTTTSLSSLNSDSAGFQQVYHLTYSMLGLITTIIGVAILIVSFNYLLILACILTGIVATIMSNLINKNSYKRRDEISEKDRQNSYFYNTGYDFSYGKDIRIYNLQPLITEKHKKATRSYMSVIYKLAKFNFFASLVELVPLLLQDGLAYFLVIWSYYQGDITIAELSMYLLAVASLSTYLRELGRQFSEIRGASRYVRDLYELMDDTSLYSREGGLAPLTETFDIEFDHVSFKYPKTDKWIFKDLSFKIKKGEKLAIVGANGAGKTTIVKLICGLFEPTEGVIRINGIDTKEFDKQRYQEMFSVVFQDVKVFAASVIENVVGPHATEEDIEFGKQAIEAVGLKDKVESLPLKYDHPILRVIDENGLDLSGGEKQKLAIARALYKRGQVVILDEPTAALDALAEAKIYEEFNELAGGKTSIYVSHRLSSTKFCDRIALFDKETLAEFGTHDELMEQKGIYYQMFTTQGKYYQEEVEHVQNIN